MTRIALEVQADGSAVLADPYGSETMVSTFDCDQCGTATTFDQLWEALTPRPSTGELVAVLWMCPPCGREFGLTEHTPDCEHG